jgi:hypothetical protein
MGLGVAAVVGLNGLEPKRFGEVGGPEAGTGEGGLEALGSDGCPRARARGER